MYFLLWISLLLYAYISFKEFENWGY